MDQTILPKRAFISIGSNIEPEANLPQALSKLKRLGEIVSVSYVYQNPPIGRPEQQDFLNAAVLLLTTHKALDLRRELRIIEEELGRLRTEDKNAPRTMDLDLCFFEDLIIQSPGFVLPDPDVSQRAHLAIPLADLDPGFEHPITGESLAAIANRLRQEADLTRREDVEIRIQSQYK